MLPGELPRLMQTKLFQDYSFTWNDRENCRRKLRKEFGIAQKMELLFIFGNLIPGFKTIKLCAVCQHILRVSTRFFRIRTRGQAPKTHG